MQMNVQNPLRNTLLLGACVLAAAAYICLTSLQYMAAYFSQKPDLISLQRAAKLQPGNAEYRYRLGTFLVDSSPQSALESYKSAVKLNPHNAHYWLGLAAVYQNLGSINEQETALENAVRADPKTPDIAWDAANFYLIQGETEKALHPRAASPDQGRDTASQRHYLREDVQHR